MMLKKNILAISGSTRRSSTNLSFIKAIADLTAESFKITLFEGLSALPHFNPDLDTENPPKEIRDFRESLKKADGILICTPEYAMGVPGTLKNAIDWTVSSCEFSQKPVALITASSQGENAHHSLLLTLKIIEAKIDETTAVHIPFATAKITDDSITDESALNEVKKLLEAFKNILISAGS